MQSKYPGIRIVKESHQEPLWGWLRVGHHDGLIFDRCGRLAKHIRIPRQSVEISQELFNTLRTILTGHPCGFCNYDAASERRIQINMNYRATTTPQVFAPQITAYVVPHPKTWKGSQQQEEGGNQISQSNTDIRQSNGNGNGRFPSIQADYSNNGKSSGKIYAQQQQPGVFGQEEEAFTEITAPKSGNTKFNGNGKSLPTTSSSTPTLNTNPKPIEPLYSDDAEVAQAPSEYYDYVSEWTTPNPPQNVQIPKPTSPSSAWPTKMPSIKDRIVSPCAGYTDDICYQQQTQLVAAEVHKCCKQRVLFTDQCIPGRCSNATQQLCCIQKFLQAKSTCCLDEHQGDPTSGTDKFSQCCYQKFVESEDPCCSYSYSHSQWKSVHELCLPHVFVDLSNIKVKTVVPGTSVTTDFHFGQTNRWKFECKYGGHVPQYSYFEDDEESIIAE
uniref:Selenoprotein P N-terminal domain-containing protein n=1 Tax=Panagrolaimus superbus TaxID=310955 RepID=A0A914Z5I0_9BILA